MHKMTDPNSTPDPVRAPDAGTFRYELECLINKFSLERPSDTPDFILASFLSHCLHAWNTATQQRESWYGRNDKPVTPRPPIPSAASTTPIAKAVIRKLNERAEWWRNQPDDPHHVATPVIVALHEVAAALKAALP